MDGLLDYQDVSPQVAQRGIRRRFLPELTE
jgi:hypothetical protein